MCIFLLNTYFCIRRKNSPKNEVNDQNIQETSRNQFSMIYEEDDIVYNVIVNGNLIEVYTLEVILLFVLIQWISQLIKVFS